MNELRDEIDLLIKQAKEAGFHSVKDFVKHVFSTWNKQTDKAIIKSLYEKFLEAIQYRQKKMISEGYWNENSTFEEYLDEAIKTCESRLEELKWRKKTQEPSFSYLVHILPYMENVPKGVGEPLTQEDYEFYEMILKKCLELYKKCLSDEKFLNEMLL